VIGLVVLATAWGVLAASPLAVRARRLRVRDRARPLTPSRRTRPRTGAGQLLAGGRAAVARAAGPVGRVVTRWRQRRRARFASLAVGAELPLALDLLGVAVAAGCTPYLALDVASRWAPPRIGERFRLALRSCALGESLGDALEGLAHDVPALRPLVDALRASERLGAPVGPALARLADEERAALRRRADAHARRVPVRLLFPLVFLVLPAFGLLTLVPAVASGLART
jgi:tight adherence protein C